MFFRLLVQRATVRRGGVVLQWYESPRINSNSPLIAYLFQISPSADACQPPGTSRRTICSGAQTFPFSSLNKELIRHACVPIGTIKLTFGRNSFQIRPWTWKFARTKWRTSSIIHVGLSMESRLHPVPSAGHAVRIQERVSGSKCAFLPTVYRFGPFSEWASSRTRVRT